jgi:serine/threonine protein kinase
MLLFNRYQYEPSTDIIGKGEFSLVYEALDTYIYLPVAVKIYRAVEASEKFGFVQVNRFMGLDHPNICRYLHMGEIKKENVHGIQEKRQVCVMELLRDGDLASYYQAHPQPEMLRKMVLDILHGITYLHSQRIVHRRLKPSNMLVGMTTQGPVVKITDFGLGTGKATLRDANFSSMVVEATRMAPELFNAREYGIDGNVSYHVDFWGLGLAVYEALTNNDVLFKNSPGESREQVIRNILSPKLPDKIQQLPAPFDRFVMRCLAKHAESRPQNTRELIELLSQPLSTIYPVYSAPPVRAPRREEPGEMEPVNEVMMGDAARMKPVPQMTAATPVTTVASLTVVGEAEAPVKLREVHPFFQRYEYNPVTDCIGKGGFSRVYKAFDKKLNRWVALKFYKHNEVGERYSPTAEIRRVINLDHPNICRYLDIEDLEKENVFGEKEITQVSVMELLDGGNLLEYYSTHPGEEVLRKLLSDVLKGLVYLHKSGIIHRDIKPANILIRETSEGPVAKITDFGVSKASGGGMTNHSSALVVSIPYMAPEQLNVKKYGIDEKISFNLDLWALGVTLFEVVTGKVLFKNRNNDSNEEIMANILAPGLQEKLEELPPPFFEIVRRCLVKDARRRAQRAEELIELLCPSVELVPQQPVEIMPEPVKTAERGAPGERGTSVERRAELAKPANENREAEIRPASEEARPIEIRPEMRLIPDPNSKTQDLFATGKSWVWAEAVSAPMVEEGEKMEIADDAGRRRDAAPWIALVAAMTVVVVTTYIIIQNRRMATALNPMPAKTEMIGTAKPPARNDLVKNAAAQIPVANKMAVTEDVTVTDKEKLTDDETITTENAYDKNNEEESGPAPVRYVVYLSTPKTCSIHINDTSYGLLDGGKTMKVFLTPGSYTIRAASTGKDAEVYSRRLNVSQNDINHWRKYKIHL